MNKNIVILILLSGLAAGQGSKFTDLDVIVYPEYYYEGIMVEVNGSLSSAALPLKVDFTVPAHTDSAFFVSGEEAEQNIKHLTILSSENRHYLSFIIRHEKFRLFFFYNIDKTGQARNGSFTFQMDQFLGDAHLIVQKPVVAHNFKYSEKEAQSYEDQHGIEFLRLHLHDYDATKGKTISFSYDNPSGETSIEHLQKMLSSNDRNAPEQGRMNPPGNQNRYKLMYWQPLAVLGSLAIIIGIMFAARNKKAANSKPGKFCSSCGRPLKAGNKYCGNCGEKF
ncbi:MAG: zinc ribbon domain-containing protein [Candidatus Neomarinimicrobiota bacterium]